MSSFATLADTTAPVRVILVGAGQMGRHWLDVLTGSPDVSVVGLVDIDFALVQRVIADRGLDSVVAGTNVSVVNKAVNADAVVNVTIPVAHHPITTEALLAGLPVLSEKPIAPTVREALSLAATADVAGQLLMTSQSRRYYRVLSELRRAVRTLGEIGTVTTEFYRGPHFGGFRDEMEQPLLVDMAIHAFDVSRYLLDANPVSVYCETFNPGWSWYAGDASASATFEFEGGTRYVFTGSWCSVGADTSWNGNWRISAAGGTALWDGETSPQVKRAVDAVDAHGEENTPAAVDKRDSGPEETAGAEEIAGALGEFVSSLRTGVTPSGDVHSNVNSLAMVEAAVLSAATGSRVMLPDVLEAAWAEAVAAETRPDVKDRLTSWGSAAAGLARA